MDNINSNNKMPIKETSSDFNSKKKDDGEDLKNVGTNFTEIENPQPSRATPSFPDEMPPRDYR